MDSITSSLGALSLDHTSSPVKVEPVKVEAVKVEPVKVEAVKVEPVKVEAVKVEAVKVEPVLELCPIPESIDLAKLSEYVNTYMIARSEFYKETGRNLYIEDEFSEWWVAKASSGVQIGKGSEGTDVKTSINEGVDAMCVIMNKTQSNEKSLIQNFSESGIDLDSLFKDKKDKEAVDKYMAVYKTKLESVQTKHSLTALYILAFISTQTEIHLCCFKLHLDRISTVASTGFTEAGKNIRITGFIDNSLGLVCLYKSKKRVELRLKKECITHEHARKIYTTVSKEP